jgi:hypothetical protein
LIRSDANPIRIAGNTKRETMATQEPNIETNSTFSPIQCRLTCSTHFHSSVTSRM